MKNALKSAAAFAATLVAFVCITLGVTAFVPPVATLDSLPALNTGGDAVYASLQIADATGVVTTVATGGTFVALAGAPTALGEDDGSGCLTASLTTGRITVAARCGVGELELLWCGNDVIGANNATVQGAFHRIRSGSTTLIGPTARKTEAATAARSTLGCVRTIVDAQLGDTYEWRYTSGTNADTVTTRAANFSAKKILDK